jgi:hypothetical protein
MKRIVLLLAACLVSLPVVAFAGDYHVGATLPCYDCHTMHYSKAHDYSSDVAGFGTTTLAAGGPFDYLLRQPGNDLCLACHNNQPWAPDVFGQNTGAAIARMGGALNAAPGHLANDAGYDEGDGHSLWSTAVAPGGTWTAPGTEGLECVHCHAQHGIATQYRNLLNRGTFTGKALTYAKVTNDLTKDVFVRAPLYMDVSAVDFNEPNVRQSAYGNWCKSCHVDFHGQGGDANMGGQQANNDSTNAVPWKRHPTADVNIGSVTGTFVSSLAQYNAHPATNRVKVLDSQGLWGTGGASPNTVTPSCMSCHKGHGNKNSYGLIWMGGVGPVTEEGDDAATLPDGSKYIALCRQCHSQASGYAVGYP